MRLKTLLILIAIPVTAGGVAPLRFVLLGDRTGETQPGVYEQVWKAVAAEKPEFVVSAGDTIQGLNDATADAEWQTVMDSLRPYRGIPLFPAPGNHDIWSATSEKLFTQYTGHAPHYSFDRGPAHFTVLDNSRSDQFSDAEMAFLEDDLKAHAAQPVKFIVSHRPGWIFNVVLHNPDFPLQRLAKQYGVQFVIAGHVHELLHYKLDGVEYLSLPSAGGHLRGNAKYVEGWFFGYISVEIGQTKTGYRTAATVHALGEGVTTLERWGAGGLAPTQ